MAQYQIKTPTYRLHKPSGRAVVTIGGTDFYLGDYDSPQNRQKYQQLVGEWIARRWVTIPSDDAGSIATLTFTVTELMSTGTTEINFYKRDAVQGALWATDGEWASPWNGLDNVVVVDPVVLEQ